MFDILFKKISENAAESDVAGGFPEKEFKWMSDEGLLELVLPGEQLDFNRPFLKCLLQLLKNTGAANLSVGRIYEGHINALHLVHLYGTAKQQDKWNSLVRENKKIFGVWNAEDNEGIQIHPLPGGVYRLSGAKTFCSGAHWIQRPVITGKLMRNDKAGWQMCVIPMEKVLPVKEDPDFWRPMGMKASASFKMDFTDTEIEEDDLLGEPDCYYTEPWFNGGSIRFAAVQLGGAIAIMEATHKFLKQINRTESDFQKARIAEMAILAESGNNWLNTAADKMQDWQNDPETIRKYIAYAGMVRTAVESICSRILYLSEVSVGTRGLMQPNPLERMHRDLHFYLRQPAPDAVLTGIGNYLFNTTNLANVWK